MAVVGSGGRVAVLPGTNSLPIAPLMLTVSEILLVGAEAVGARGLIERQIALGMKGAGTGELVKIETAESLLEAVLVSGERVDGAGQGSRGKLFVVGVGQETEHLEAGLRSLKRVNPSSRVVLLCEPTDEVLCRRAKAWGAEEYYISPLDVAGARKMLMPPPPGAAPITVPTAPAGRMGTLEHFQESAAGVLSSRELTGPAGRGAAAAMLGGAELPSLPLIVQTELLDDLLNGRADFVQRAIGAVSEHLKVGGALRFVAAGAEEDLGKPGAIRRVVSAPDQPTFGTLILEPVASGAVLGAPAAAALAQVGNWLGGMLALARRYEQLRSLAITDELSGAYNRRYFSKYMASLLERARENRFRVTLLLFDIDDFKRYNDTFGHASGDAIIRELIKLLRACTRPHDLVARIGGDEFAVVYWDNEAPRQPNSEHPKDVLVATERFREAIKNHHWPQTCNIKGEVSISGGLATFPWDADTLEILMAKADEALLRAKSTGKNVIVMHGAEADAAARGQRVGT